MPDTRTLLGQTNSPQSHLISLKNFSLTVLGSLPFRDTTRHIPTTPYDPRSLPAMKKPSERYLTTKEAAEYMSVHPNTLTKWRQRGEGPKFSRAGRSIRYKPQEIERYLGSPESEHGK